MWNLNIVLKITLFTTVVCTSLSLLPDARISCWLFDLLSFSFGLFSLWFTVLLQTWWQKEEIGYLPVNTLEKERNCWWFGGDLIWFWLLSPRSAQRCFLLRARRCNSIGSNFHETQTMAFPLTRFQERNHLLIYIQKMSVICNVIGGCSFSTISLAFRE